MKTLLTIYDADINKEYYAIFPLNNYLGKFDAIHELMQIAKDNSICGWINEYDLDWSTEHCANKHEL